MYQLANNIFKKQKLFFLFTIVVFLTVVLIGFWINSTRVSAQILPVVVNVEHLDFGTVFPGETLEGNFIVTYATTTGGVYYRIIQKPKPLPEGHPEYPGYYKDLCPFLEKVSVETEGDTEDRAYVGEDDTSDTWIIYFKVPAIFGHVAQEHIGGVVSSSGEYGCDVSIDILEQ